MPRRYSPEVRHQVIELARSGTKVAKLAGTIDAESGAVSFDDVEWAGDYGVVDELCHRVILAAGTVLAVRAAEVPGGGPAAAILRYPV